MLDQLNLRFQIHSNCLESFFNLNPSIQMKYFWNIQPDRI